MSKWAVLDYNNLHCGLNLTVHVTTLVKLYYYVKQRLNSPDSKSVPNVCCSVWRGVSICGISRFTVPVKQTWNHLSALITDYNPCLQLTCPISNTQHTISMHTLMHTQVNTQLKRRARASLTGTLWTHGPVWVGNLLTQSWSEVAVLDAAASHKPPPAPPQTGQRLRAADAEKTRQDGSQSPTQTEQRLVRTCGSEAGSARFTRGLCSWAKIKANLSHRHYKPNKRGNVSVHRLTWTASLQKGK